MQLIINTFGTSLRRKGERFLIKSGDKQVAFSAQKVQSIIIATGAHFSSDAIHLAAQHNIDVVFLDKRGDPTARVWQTKMGSTATIRRRQLEAAETSDAMNFVRDWTSSKLENQRMFLQELQRRRPGSDGIFGSALTALDNCVTRLQSLDGTVDDQRQTIMGIEGSAGRAYFSCLSELMPAEYRFSGRSRQPARDPFNAMLNYGLGVLYSQVERATILAGLDPFVGFLHTDNYNKRSLVFDMIEPFRILAERTAVLFFTGRRVQKDFFRKVPGGTELTPEGRAALLTKLNERLDRTVRYPVQDRTATQRIAQKLSDTPDTDSSQQAECVTGSPRSRGHKRKKKFRKIKQRAVIQHEAHALANALLGRHDVPKIVETKDIWAEEAS